MESCYEPDRDRSLARPVGMDTDAHSGRFDSESDRSPSFRELARLAPVAIFSADQHGHYVFVNEKWCRLTGLDPQQAARTGWQNAIHCDDRSRVAAEWQDAVAAGTEYRGEFRLRAASGTEVWVRATVAVARSRAGAVNGFLGTWVNITGRKRAETALCASEARFRAFMEHNPAAAFIKDEGGDYVYLNRTAQQILSAQGPCAPRCVFPGALAAQAGESDRAVLDAGLPVESLMELPTPDGGSRSYAVSKFPLPAISGRKFVGGIAVDVTALRSVQKELSRSEERFRRLVESNIIGIVTADRERIIDANDAYLAMVGYTRDELSAGKIRWPEMTPPEFDELNRTALREMLESGACTPFEKEHVHKDGHRVPILLGAVLVRRDPMEWVCFILDLSVRKGIEARLREAQRYESVGLLAAGIAHDFNNLMAAVLGWTSFVRGDLPAASSAHKGLQMVSSAAERAAELTRQLLAYAGKGGFVVEPVQVHTVIRELIAQLRDRVSPDVRLEIDMPDPLPALLADPTQIRMLAANLIENALEALGPDPGVVSIRACVRQIERPDEDPRSAGEPLPAGRCLCLTVEDSGCGIDPATRDRIFDPFFSTKFLGRGLGLAAVKGIVAAQGGSIRVATTPGRGSTFEVWLPVGEMA